MTAETMLFAMLRSVICGFQVDEQVKNACTPELLQKTFVLAKKHDLGHLVGQAAADWKLPECEAAAVAKQTAMQALYRYMRLEQTYQQVCGLFEQARIPYIPLKGSVIRNQYPQPWMRTSCDIDILVPEEDLKRAVDLLVESGFRTDNKLNYHDVSLFSPTGTHLELHFSIKEHMENIDQLLSQVWTYSRRETEDGFRYDQTEEFFVFHHIAHMSYHFIRGGCGVKPFVDLYIIRNKMKFDDSLVRKYCRGCALEEFYDNVLYVTDVWFGDKAHTLRSRQIEEYIMKGGVYGTLENQVVVEQSKQGSKMKYALSRIFLPYDSLKILYPVLIKHKWLFPFMQLRRWLGLVFGGKLKRGVRELRMNQNVSENEVTAMGEFLKGIGL